MIFDKLVALKISLDFYSNNRNPFKKIIHYFLLKTIINRIKIIKKGTVSFELISEFQEFVNVADQEKMSNIISNEYEYSNTYAQEIIIKQPESDNIVVLLKHKHNTIEIHYPINPRYRVNRIYKGRIEDKSGIIKDSNTITINNSIRNYIYDFILSYMKGEFDYDETKVNEIGNKS